MKLITLLLSLSFFCIAIHGISMENAPKLNIFSLLIDTDYSPTAHAFSGVKNIESEYQTFKEQVAKNTSIDYSKCVDYIKEQKCNNIDQWQSVIEELQLENSNSIEIEVPFLAKRKQEKIEKLKEVLLTSEDYDNRLIKIASELQEHKNGLVESSRQITVMYKLPDEIDENSFVEKQANLAATLNSDVPDVAKQELAKAKQQYDIADQSIQAQTAQNVLKSASEKLIETLEHLQKAFEQKISDLRAEKSQLKEDILRLRALLANEQAIQDQNTQKISEVQQRIEKCKGKPTNIEKDCEPIKLRAAKLYTEIDIINSRTTILSKELETLMTQNINVDEVLKQKQEEQKWLAEQQAQEQEEFSFLRDEKQNGNQSQAPYDPEEREPIHHLPGIKGEQEKQ
eukprot:TRINITY_DN1121_c0_g1_i4.p1 TRINITY_DN1121_c0_g1~~TRINITY_DN1121_c0_g1_i4.p1  ORF type:complete len:398 (-),score=92.46 TRINITY_DN1121_c0_g1_i4:161-1354(-)